MVYDMAVRQHLLPQLRAGERIAGQACAARCLSGTHSDSAAAHLRLHHCCVTMRHLQAAQRRCTALSACRMGVACCPGVPSPCCCWVELCWVKLSPVGSARPRRAIPGQGRPAR